MAYLLIFYGDNPPMKVPLLKPKIVIGRSVSCELTIPDRHMSKVHAKIELNSKAYYLIAARTTNGTFVNGKPVASPVKLVDGDEVLMGTTKLYFVDEGIGTAPLVATKEIDLMFEGKELKPIEGLIVASGENDTSMLGSIFVSHASGDDPWVANLISRLETKGFITWVDHRDIEAGRDWNQEILKALNVSKYMIVVLTENSVKSKNVRIEWEEFLDKEKPIFPILAESLDSVPIRLRLFQMLDFSTDFDESLDRLVAALRKRVNED